MAYLSGARCRLAYSPADATATHFSCFSKIQMVSPFWYRLTQVVLDKGLLNGCKQICIAHKVVTSEASCFNTWFIYFGTAGLVRIDRPKHKRGKYNTITVLQYTHTPV